MLHKTGFDFLIDEHAGTIMILPLSGNGWEWLQENIVNDETCYCGPAIITTLGRCPAITFAAHHAGLIVRVTDEVRNLAAAQEAEKPESQPIDAKLLTKTAKRIQRSADVVRDLPCATVVN